MANTIEVSADPAAVTLVAGDTAEITATIRNKGQTVDQLILSIEGVDSAWFTVPVSSVALFPNDQDSLKIHLHPPAEAEGQTGTHTCRISVASQENPSQIAVAEVTIELKPILELGLEVSPESIRGRKGTYQVIVINPGSSESSALLRASDPANRLRYRFNLSRISVDGNSRAGATLEVRLGWLAFLGGEKEFVFHIAAVPPGAEAGAAFCPYCGERLKPDPQGVRIICPHCHHKLVDGAVVAEARLVRPALIKGLPRIRIPWPARKPRIQSFTAATEDRREYKLTWSVKRTKDVTLDDQGVPPRGEAILYPTAPTTYTLTATNKRGSFSQTVSVQPLPVPQPQTSDRIKVSMTPDKLQTHAGTVPAIANVQLQNLGEIVDKFLVEVEGIDPSWYSRSASSIALMPQATDQVRLTFHPPKKQGVKSGEYAFAVTVRSESAPEEATILAGRLEIAPAPEYRVKVRPARVNCRKKGSFRVELANTGVTDLNIDVEGVDMEENCRFEWKNGTSAVLGAWRTVELPVVVRPRRGSVIGKEKQFDITVTATPSEGVTQTTTCMLNHRPLIGSWRTVFKWIRTLIFVAGIGVAGYLAVHWGGGWDALTSDPGQWAEDLINGTYGPW